MNPTKASWGYTTVSTGLYPQAGNKKKKNISVWRQEELWLSLSLWLYSLRGTRAWTIVRREDNERFGNFKSLSSFTVISPSGHCMLFSPFFGIELQFLICFSDERSTLSDVSTRERYVSSWNIRVSKTKKEEEHTREIICMWIPRQNFHSYLSPLMFLLLLHPLGRLGNVPSSAWMNGPDHQMTKGKEWQTQVLCLQAVTS